MGLNETNKTVDQISAVDHFSETNSRYLRNSVIGCNKQKEYIIELDLAPRLVQLITDESSNESRCYETVAIICSLSKGTSKHIQALIKAGVIPVLMKLITDQPFNERLVDISLRALRSIYVSSLAPVELIYETKSFGKSFVTFLLELANNAKTWRPHECVVNILAHSCLNAEHQMVLMNSSAIQTIATLLQSPAYKVKIPALQLLSQICYRNDQSSEMAVKASANGHSIPALLAEMMSQSNTPTMQLLAAKCMTNMHRANAITASDRNIIYCILPTLARLCKDNNEPIVRAMAADTLAYLIEVNAELQKIASVCDHVVFYLGEFFKYQPPETPSISKTACCLTTFRASDISYLSENGSTSTMKELTIAQELKKSALKAFASLAANDEEIRKKIVAIDKCMETIVQGLGDFDTRICLAALKCLHSLSRSVQQLRTALQDHSVWMPLKSLLHSADDDVLAVVSNTLCNLLLEFSPNKPHFLDQQTLDLICNLTKKEDSALRLNGVWILMNTAYHTDQTIQHQIMLSLGTNQIFRLLSDHHPAIVIKTLGLIRNLLSMRYHTDSIMNTHGKQLMQAVEMILDSEHSMEIKEQALCILGNVANGSSAKDFIISNDDLLKKLAGYMVHGPVKLQMAAVFCISNLAWNEEKGAVERQQKLKELGIKDILKDLLNTSDTSLFDKVKTAFEQFPNK